MHAQCDVTTLAQVVSEELLPLAAICCLLCATCCPPHIPSTHNSHTRTLAGTHTQTHKVHTNTHTNSHINTLTHTTHLVAVDSGAQRVHQLAEDVALILL